MLASIIRPSSRFICVRQFVQLSTPLYQGSGASATGEDIPELLTDADFKNAVLATKDDKLSVFQFTAVWCGPCQAIKPQILNYSMQYPDVKFYKIDVDNNKISNTVIENQISAVPTFIFMKNEKAISQVQGAHPEQIQTILRTQSS
eukprot:TRINITY_DN9675_c0_g2_i3.p1 TRINITY_DN9675_c0_g2~~TRINITY_DN9675_c0_g2_i3.p1  ORF type:complete len:146 (+),score=6.91 TRINITY_DN9675_c0_g2_i3:124-561(+)